MTRRFVAVPVPEYGIGAYGVRDQRTGQVWDRGATKADAKALARDWNRAARRQAERDADWDTWVEQALANAGDHSLELAEHTGRAMRAVEEAGDE